MLYERVGAARHGRYQSDKIKYEYGAVFCRMSGTFLYNPDSRRNYYRFCNPADKKDPAKTGSLFVWKK